MGRLVCDQISSMERLFNKNEPTWFHVSVLSRSSLSFVLPDSTPTRWLTVHCVKLAEWCRGTGLGNNIPILNMMRSSAEGNLIVTLCVDWRPFARLFENEGEELSLNQLRTVHSMVDCFRKGDWTNDSERFFLANWPTWTESRKIIMKSITNVPKTQATAGLQTACHG